MWNIMIVYGGGSVKRNGILDEVRKTLEECGKTVFEFGGVASSPSYEKILEGIAMYKKENIDLMIALGGGSVVDSTKIMASGAEIEGDIWDEEMIRHNIPEKMGKYAVVLTISGAGAEMDHLGACTNEKTHEKKTFVGPYADFVIEDPAYVMSVPLHTFTPGVFDSLSHCMETCFGQGTNVWDEIIESLMKNIIRNGKALMKDPDNMEIRSDLMWDSSLIQSFSFYTGKPGDFQAHGIENMLAAYTHAAHGRQLAILQPVYYDHIVEAGSEMFARFAVNVMEVDPEGKMKKESRKYTADRIGIVCPLYEFDLPSLVKDFILTSEFETEYFYIVMTYGMHHGGCAARNAEFLEKEGKHIDYFNTVQMLDNALPVFDIEEQRKLDPEKKEDEHLALIKADLDAEKKYIQPASKEEVDFYEGYKANAIDYSASIEKPRYKVSDKCIGCGICTRVCPKGCIRVEDGRAVYDYTNCFGCMSCIHACPQKAIGYAVIQEKNPNARYRHPEISLAEIIQSNNQN